MNEKIDESKENESGRIAFESLEILVKKWADGSITEIFNDWKWILSYSKKYKWAIVYSTIMGLIGTTMGLVSSVVSKYLLDIIVGYKTEYLGMLIAMMVGSTAFSLIVGNWLGHFNLKLSIKINQTDNPLLLLTTLRREKQWIIITTVTIFIPPETRGIFRALRHPPIRRPVRRKARFPAGAPRREALPRREAPAHAG